MNNETLLRAIDLNAAYPVAHPGAFARRQYIRPVDSVSIDVSEGETLGLVGESGSGKSTLGRLLVAVERPLSGSVLFDNTDITSLAPGPLRRLRPRMQMIYQDPSSSLNPRWNAEKIISEGMAVQGVPKSKRQAAVRQYLDRVGLPASAVHKYPHEFSGGERQRLAIARALVAEPRLIVADECVSALDVSVQSKVINLLQDLKRELKLTYIFVSHDLAVVRYIADRTAVMYLGQIVELGSSEDLYRHPLHPYTMSLIDAVPRVRSEGEGERERIVIHGDPPSLLNLPSGCRFRNRCPFAMDDPCARETPQLVELAPGHAVACHLAHGIASGAFSPRRLEVGQP